MDYQINTKLLKTKLIEKNVSIEELSNKCCIDIKNLNNFFIGQKTLSTLEIVQISKELNVTFGDIITLDGKSDSYSDFSSPNIGKMWFT